MSEFATEQEALDYVIEYVNRVDPDIYLPSQIAELVKILESADSTQDTDTAVDIINRLVSTAIHFDDELTEAEVVIHRMLHFLFWLFKADADMISYAEIKSEAIQMLMKLYGEKRIQRFTDITIMELPNEPN